ncbi:thiamine phosphate synthase [Desulfosediminicola ganghwensis]|uniref:thiamine phosphate synthase n=1 Tax=Desulfosediminicola ganghwensis TaxID=2569540 RepID=UPI0010AD788E|nr:thiamine phosphate synthase [Desulfosediminicola ganghwensis]
MKLLVISTPGFDGAETETINALFSAGLEILHLRKPGWSNLQMAELLDGIDPAHHPRIMIHSNYDLLEKYQLRGAHLPSRSIHPCSTTPAYSRSRSCHSIEEVECLAGIYEYLFISPVFDSVSKQGYLSAVSVDELHNCTNSSGRRLVALGGITAQKLPELSSSICWGAAALGTIWQHEGVVERVSAFRNLQKIADRI